MTNNKTKTNDFSKLIFKKPEEHYLKSIRSGLDQIESGTNEVLRGTAKIQDAIIERDYFSGNDFYVLWKWCHETIKN